MTGQWLHPAVRWMLEAPRHCKSFMYWTIDETGELYRIGVALNDTAYRVLRDQIGKYSRYVFVHTKAKHRPDGTLTPAVRKMRVDGSNSMQV